MVEVGVAGVVRGGDRTVWVVPRDEQMLTWFSIVRIANVQTVRWVLGALNGWASPVSSRQAQSWCSRMRTAGLIETAQMGGAGGAVVWATYAGVRQAKPDLFRQTTRHEIAVAAASARYAAAGYAWQRDDKAPLTGGHQADGVALATGWEELLEVELTAKRLPRYASIFGVYRRRLEAGECDQITYLCNADAARTVRRALEQLPVGQAIASRIAVHEVFDSAGLWSGDALPNWIPTAEARAVELVSR
jgi:hypothetical protein